MGVLNFGFPKRKGDALEMLGLGRDYRIKPRCDVVNFLSRGILQIAVKAEIRNRVVVIVHQGYVGPCVGRPVKSKFESDHRDVNNGLLPLFPKARLILS